MSVPVKVSRVYVEGDYRISFGVSDVSVMSDSYSTTLFIPARVALRYAISANDRQWECIEIRVIGPTIRQDGSLGKRTLERLIMLFTNPELPPWLTALIDEYRPENHLTRNCSENQHE